MNIYEAINSLVEYGVRENLIEAEDKVWAVNRILEILNMDSMETDAEVKDADLEEILKVILDYAVEKGICEDSIVYKDLFDTKVMGVLTQRPSEVIKTFREKYNLKNLFAKIATEEQLAQITVDNVLQALENGLIENFLNSALAMRDEIKKDVWSVCFSENGFNEALWLKYADQHKGFALIYDLEKSENLLCGKQSKCQDCGITKYGTPLYPMYYSDTPHDATNFAKLV